MHLLVKLNAGILYYFNIYLNLCFIEGSGGAPEYIVRLHRRPLF